MAPTPRMSVITAAAYQLVPGIANLAVFVIAASALQTTGLPIIFALGAGILFAEVPISWLLIFRRVRVEAGAFSWRAAFPWWEKIPVWIYWVIGVPVIFLSAGLIGSTAPIAAELQGQYFAWVPDWLVLESDPSKLVNLHQPLQITLLAMSVFVFMLIGGVTQELYARGFLLPRIAYLGPVGAPVVNALLFAMLHFVAPWQWPTFFLVALIWAGLVYWRRSVKIGLVTHVGMLALQSVGLALLVLGITPPPAP